MGTKLGNDNRAVLVREQLGVNYGIAIYRLTRKILFHLIQQIGMDVCFKCGEKISSFGELSIEHKRPWYKVSAELFWDMENIAFSHVKCNRPHRYHGGVTQRKIGPEGTSWCTGHKDFLPVSEFYKKARNGRFNGLSYACKKCQYNYNKKFRKRRKMVNPAGC